MSEAAAAPTTTAAPAAPPAGPPAGSATLTAKDMGEAAKSIALADAARGAATAAVAPAAGAATPTPVAPAADVTTTTTPKPAPSLVRPAGSSDAERLAQFAKREAAINRDRQAAAKEREAVDQSKAEIEWAKQLRAAAKSDNKAKILELLEVDYNALTVDVLKKGAENDPAQKALREVEALKREREADRQSALKAAQEAAETQRQSALAAWRNSFTAHVEARADAYPLTAKLGQGNVVAQFAEEHYRQSCKFDDAGKVIEEGEVLSPDQAAEKFEAALDQQVEKALTLTKYQARLQQQTATQPKPDQPKEDVPKPLHSGLTASTPPPRPPAKSWDERVQRANEAADRVEREREARRLAAQAK